MHDGQYSCVLEACLALNVPNTLPVERIQVHQVDALSDSILFQAVNLIVLLSEQLKMRMRPQVGQVALRFDEVV